MEALLPCPEGSGAEAVCSYKPYPIQAAQPLATASHVPHHLPHPSNTYPASDPKPGPMLGARHKTQHLP